MVPTRRLLNDKTDWVGRAFRLSAAKATIVVALGLLASWIATYSLGGAGRVPPHWFYVPILIAAARFGLPGTVLTAVLAGLLAGPLVPLDVAQGTTQPVSDWLGRMGFFAGNGLIMAVVIGQLRSVLSRELAIANATQELARQKEAVIHTVSHEFRTPLTIIRGSVDLFSEPGLVSAEAEPLVQAIAQATQRLENLITLVLAAAGALVDPENERRESIALEELCVRVASALDQLSEPSRIRFVASPDAETVVCDPVLLELALHAVIDNALKFSPPLSSIEITTHRVHHDVELRVRDTGPGMSEDELRRLFEPFAQKNESIARHTQGVGLGLFSARKTAELLGGTLDLRRVADGGTEAILTIPQ